MRYLFSKNKSEIICYKLAIIVLLGIPCMMCSISPDKTKKTGYFGMYCLSVYLVYTQRYHLFSDMATDHSWFDLRFPFRPTFRGYRGQTVQIS